MKKFFAAVAKCTAIIAALCAVSLYYFKAFTPTFEVMRGIYGESIYSDANTLGCMFLTFTAVSILLIISVFVGLLLRENAKKVVKLRKKALSFE